MSERLFRSRDDRMLAGVAGGLAELWDADPSLVRIVWALLALFSGGLAVVVYIVMAIVVPEEDPGSWPAAAGPVNASPAPDTAAPAVGTPVTTGWVAPADDRAARRAARAARKAERGARGDSGARIVLGGLLVVLGIFFLARQWLPPIDTDWLWPAMLIVLGVLLLATAVSRGRDGGGRSGTGGSAGTPGGAA